MMHDWKERHPFVTGATVVARNTLNLPGGRVIAAGSVLVVQRRGEDDWGCWFASDAVAGVRLDAADFTLPLPVMPPCLASDDEVTA